MKIWSGADLSTEAISELVLGTEGHTLVLSGRQGAGNLTAFGPQEDMYGAEVAFGQPDVDQVIESPEIKWVHLTSAGYTRYDTDAFREAMAARGGICTNSSSVYDEPCAQHALAFMLAAARRLPEAVQGGDTWPYAPVRFSSRVIQGDRVLIFGYGAIARRLTQLLKPFGVEVIGFRRRPTGEEGVPVFPIEQAEAWLPKADHIMNILPASAATEQYFNADRIAQIKPGAFYYSIGRGTTTDQVALLDALITGHLGYAYLDVTDPEPLTPGHPLWTAPNCFITPHTAGGRQEEAQHLVRHFLRNLRLYTAGEALLDRIV